MSDELEEVARTARRRARSDAAYRAALLRAWRAGLGYADIARAAGVTRQTMREKLQEMTR